MFLWVSNLVPFGRGDPRQSIVTQTRAILGNKACSDTRPGDRAPTLLKHVFCLLASTQLPEEEVARQVILYFESCVLREHFTLRELPKPFVSELFYPALTSVIVQSAAYTMGREQAHDLVQKLGRALESPLRSGAWAQGGYAFRCSDTAVELGGTGGLAARVAFATFAGPTMEEEEARNPVVPEVPEHVHDRFVGMKPAYAFHKELWRVAKLCGRNVKLLPLEDGTTNTNITSAKSTSAKACLLIAAYVDSSRFAQHGANQMYLFIKMTHGNKFSVEIREEARQGQFNNRFTAKDYWSERVRNAGDTAGVLYGPLKKLNKLLRRVMKDSMGDVEGKWRELEGELCDMYEAAKEAQGGEQGGPG